MSLSADVAAVLEADQQLMALLSGGVHTGVEITRQGMPSAFDGETKELAPCALVKTPLTTATGPYEDSANSTLTIFVYQRSGTDTITAAMDRMVALLNRSKIGSHTWEIRFNNRIDEARDDGLAASLGQLRFDVVRRMA